MKFNILFSSLFSVEEFIGGVENNKNVSEQPYFSLIAYHLFQVLKWQNCKTFQITDLRIFNKLYSFSVLFETPFQSLFKKKYYLILARKFQSHFSRTIIKCLCSITALTRKQTPFSIAICLHPFSMVMRQLTERNFPEQFHCFEKQITEIIHCYMNYF